MNPRDIRPPSLSGWNVDDAVEYFGLDRSAPAVHFMAGESVPWWKRKLWHLGARIEWFGLKVQGWAE